MVILDQLRFHVVCQFMYELCINYSTQISFQSVKWSYYSLLNYFYSALENLSSLFTEETVFSFDTLHYTCTLRRVRARRIYLMLSETYGFLNISVFWEFYVALPGVI